MNPGTGVRIGCRAMLILAALTASTAWAVQDCELNGEPVNPANGHATEGRSGILRCRDLDSGQLVREQELQNGRFMGAVRYYAAGRLSREYSVNERGNMQGRSQEFAANGQLVRDASYEDGRQVGLARTYYADGQLQRASFYGPAGELAYAEFTSRGELRGLRCADRPVLAPVVDDARLCGFPLRTSTVAFMAENGAVHARATFVAGKRLRYETFQDNGLPAQQEEVTLTSRVERSFGPNGAKRREVLWAINGGKAVREREQEFAANGALTRERLWIQGELSSESTYYLNGQPRSKARYAMVDNKRLLETREFYDNGVLAAEGRYIDTGRYAPMPTGAHRRYDMQGRLKSESVYDSRGRIIRERAWDADGNLLRDDELSEDSSRKVYTR